MRLYKVSLSILLAATLQAEPYTLGQGYRIDEMLTIGGYFSTEFEKKNSDETATLDDVAVMAYGNLDTRLSYLAEFESVGFYHKNFSTGDEGGDRKFHIERLYGDLWLSDAYNVRFGKQITPVGYWNKEPINVLRDSSSNPLYSSLLFPKFLTGIDINGYIPGVEGVEYHLFGQNNRDFDPGYINIENNHFFGLAIEKEISSDWTAGGSVGDYIPVAGDQRTRYAQVNAKYDDTIWQVMAEGIVAKSNYTNTSDYTVAGYVQGLYRYSPEHAVFGRAEHFSDRYTNYEDNIAVVGYSYRPLYPVSLKGEYQWHSLEHENRVLISFSVLF